MGRHCVYYSLLVVLLLIKFHANGTPLDDYVTKPDDSYRYEVLGDPQVGPEVTSYYINLTSQTWLTSADVDRYVWWHYLVVNVPHSVGFTDTALVYVTGGKNTLNRPDISGKDSSVTVSLSAKTKTVTAALFQIPNQPVVFTSDPLKQRRVEDAAVAYTWYYFTKHSSNSTEWPLMLPMTKAVVRAMDTITDFMLKQNSKINITKFVIGGGSKRGWTTWTTGAVDKRVIGIVPIVMDLLNVRMNLHHHFRSLGGWTIAFKDYIALNITMDLDSSSAKLLFDMIDPFNYIDRLTMPKFVITTGGDEFFLPDDSHYFWDDLKGEKFIQTLPNAEHTCFGHIEEVAQSVEAFYLSILTNSPRPKLTWTLSQDAYGGSIVFKTDTEPIEVVHYHATTLDGKRRDFRMLVGPDPYAPKWHFVKWHNETLQQQSVGVYNATMSLPSDGWTAFMIQATFKGPEGSVLTFTSQVNIIPDTFPFPDCHGKQCKGKLV